MSMDRKTSFVLMIISDINTSTAFLFKLNSSGGNLKTKSKEIIVFIQRILK